MEGQDYFNNESDDDTVVELIDYESDKEVENLRKKRKIEKQEEIRKEHFLLKNKDSGLGKMKIIQSKGNWLEHKTRDVITKICKGECNLVKLGQKDEWTECTCECRKCIINECKECENCRKGQWLRYGDFGKDFYGNITVDGTFYKFIGQCKNYFGKNSIGSEPMAALKGCMSGY